MNIGYNDNFFGKSDPAYLSDALASLAEKIECAFEAKRKELINAWLAEDDVLPSERELRCFYADDCDDFSSDEVGVWLKMF